MASVTTHAGRRKACDFCVSRKIKCDSLKPVCSNCKLYGVGCCITDAINTSRKRAPLAPEPHRSQLRTDRDSSIETRLASIEARLDQIANNPSGSQPRQVTGPSPAGRSAPQLSFQNFPEVRVYKASDMWNQATTLPCLGISPQLPTTAGIVNTAQLELPPLVEILPALDNYFENYNSITPLFDRAAFLHMAIDWYSTPSKRTLISWAAINVVTAISYRVLDDMPMDDPRLVTCIQNCQAVTTELMAWGEDLLGLQVLLGMVILFQGTTNPQLAIVLIGSAMRLAQSMGLPSANADSGLSPAVLLARRRIFWIAYILDRDLSLRAKVPYTQLDAETDLVLPGRDAEDCMGILVSKTGHIRFNYLHARAELAVIQGKVHNLLYSRTSQRLSEEQKSGTLRVIEQMLSNWRSGIPPALLRADDLFKGFDRIPIHLMMNMHNRYLECLYRIYGNFAFEEAWISRVCQYLRPTAIELGEDGIDSEVDHSELPPLPEKWAECVQQCRLGLELSAFGRETEYSIWLHSCCNLSSLIILLVNIIEFPDHPLVVPDWDLIARIRGMFEQMNAKASQEPFFLLTMAWELDRRARGQVKRVAHLLTVEGLRATRGGPAESESWMNLDPMYM